MQTCVGSEEEERQPQEQEERVIYVQSKIVKNVHTSEKWQMAHAQQVLNCSFDHWHPTFQAVSFRSQFISLPKRFVEYLVEDGVYLSESNAAVCLLCTNMMMLWALIHKISIRYGAVA